MPKWTVETIKDFFDFLNKRFGTNVKPEITVEKENRYPVSVRDGKLIFIPEFFNEIDDVVKKNVVVYNYSLLCYAKKTENGITFVDMNPIFMAKGICNNIGVQYLDEIERENRLRPIRRKLFKDLESVSVFKVGYKIRVRKFESYEITHIKKTEDGDVIVTAKPIGSHFGEPEKLFPEEELYNKVCLFGVFDEDHKINVRRNIFVLFGDYDADNLKMLKEIINQYPQINTPAIMTTKSPTTDEFDEKYYRFVSLNDFYNYEFDGDTIIHHISKNEHYAITFDETDKFPEDEPVIFFAGTGNRQHILSHYPFSTTILIQSEVADEKKKDANNYDYVIMGGAPDKCAHDVIEIIKNETKQKDE